MSHPAMRDRGPTGLDRVRVVAIEPLSEGFAMVFHAYIRQYLLLATLPLAVGMTGCLDEVPSDEGAHVTEEELAGDGQPESSDELIIESGAPGVLGALNLWDDRFYMDTRQVRYNYDSNFDNDGFDNKTSSLSNRTGYYWLLYEHRDYRGARLCIRPYSKVAYIDDYSFDYGIFFRRWGDDISSVKKRTTSSSSCDGAELIGY
jgi:hypothetical protein